MEDSEYKSNTQIGEYCYKVFPNLLNEFIV